MAVSSLRHINAKAVVGFAVSQNCALDLVHVVANVQRARAAAATVGRPQSGGDARGPTMRTIAVIALKGGSGKTTVATHIALAAYLRGLKTVVADYSLLVVRPTLMDIAAAVRTVDIIRRLRKPAMIVVNQAPVARDGVEPPSVKRALKALEVMRLPVVPTLLRSRAIYQSSLETGKSAEECYDVNAAREIAALWTFIERFTFGKRDAPAAEAVEDEDLKFAP
jgi:hypothetical protein